MKKRKKYLTIWAEDESAATSKGSLNGCFWHVIPLITKSCTTLRSCCCSSRLLIQVQNTSLPSKNHTVRWHCDAVAFLSTNKGGVEKGLCCTDIIYHSVSESLRSDILQTETFKAKLNLCDYTDGQLLTHTAVEMNVRQKLVIWGCLRWTASQIFFNWFSSNFINMMLQPNMLRKEKLLLICSPEWWMDWKGNNGEKLTDGGGSDVLGPTWRLWDKGAGWRPWRRSQREREAG